MKIENSKNLVDSKIEELEVSVKKDEFECKRDYFKSQVLPKIVFSLIPIIGEYFIYTSDLTDSEKLSLNIPVIIYCGIMSIVMTLFHQDYYFTSRDKDTLQRLKRIKKYLDNNINILNEVDEKDFEWYINNINDNLQLNNNMKKNKKL